MFIAFLFSLSLANADTSCPAPRPLTASEISAEGVSDWMARYSAKIKTPGDFVCCLPEEFRSRYAVAHSSVAAQRGTPDHPRALLFDSTADENTFNAVFSVSSSTEEFSHGQNIEMVFQNQRTGINTFYDLDLTAKTRTLEKNPTLCMTCHGDSRGTVGPGGPHLNFDFTGLWPRFIDGMPPCSGYLDQLQRQVQDRAAQAINEQDTFRCLDKTLVMQIHPEEPLIPITKIRKALFDLDRKLNYQNHRRIAYVLHESPKYESFKYGFMAMALCPERRHPAQVYFPEALIDTLTAKADFIPGLRESHDLRGFFKARYDEILKQAQVSSWENSRKDLAGLFQNGLNVGPGDALMCMADAESDGQADLVDTLLSEKASRLEVLVAIDTWVKQKTKGVQMEPILKLFIEGYGGTVDGLSESLIGQELRSSLKIDGNVELGKTLAQLEPPNSPWSHLASRKPTRNECAQLKTLSIKADY